MVPQIGAVDGRERVRLVVDADDDDAVGEHRRRAAHGAGDVGTPDLAPVRRIERDNLRRAGADEEPAAEIGDAAAETLAVAAVGAANVGAPDQPPGIGVERADGGGRVLDEHPIHRDHRRSDDLAVAARAGADIDPPGGAGQVADLEMVHGEAGIAAGLRPVGVDERPRQQDLAAGKRLVWLQVALALEHGDALAGQRRGRAAEQVRDVVDRTAGRKRSRHQHDAKRPSQEAHSLVPLVSPAEVAASNSRARAF